jgi:hypothetical protein
MSIFFDSSQSEKSTAALQEKVVDCSQAMKWILSDLINALPGKSSVNTFQRATIDEVVFSTSSAPSSCNNWVIQLLSK